MSVRSSRHTLDWPNQPLPFKIYTSLEPLPLPESVGRLCYFSNGVTHVLRGMPFRAAACTGALYHIELYLVCADRADLEAGVYHYAAHDNALRQLRRGDFREVVVAATSSEPGVSAAPVIAILTSTWWRNAWKYQARAYRHAFWDSGTILANLLAVASSQRLSARVIVGFADDDVNRLLDAHVDHEAAIALVALGTDTPRLGKTPDMPPLDLPTRPLSRHEVAYPEIVEAHRASSLATGAAAAAWRARHPCSASEPATVPSEGPGIQDVIFRRGSSRHFIHEPITAEQLDGMLRAATSPTPMDACVATQPYLIVNAVNGLAQGTYAFNRESRALEPLKSGEFRREATFLDLGQELAGDAALNVYWLANIDELDDRGYRAAQLAAAIEGGKLYLAAYALGLGATGLTFFDEDVTRFFSPHAARKSVMFLMAAGVPKPRGAL